MLVCFILQWRSQQKTYIIIVHNYGLSLTYWYRSFHNNVTALFMLKNTMPHKLMWRLYTFFFLIFSWMSTKETFWWFVNSIIGNEYRHLPCALCSVYPDHFLYAGAVQRGWDVVDVFLGGLSFVSWYKKVFYYLRTWPQRVKTNWYFNTEKNINNRMNVQINTVSD